MLADFLIGANAAVEGWPILTFENPTPLLPTLERATGPIVGVAAIVLAVGSATVSFVRAARHAGR